MYGGEEGKLCMLTFAPNVSFMLWPLCHLGKEEARWAQSCSRCCE